MAWARAYRLPLPLLLAAVAGCVHGPRTWDDEPGNWQRAFLTERPSGVEVVRSRVIRSCRGEASGWFEIRASREREAELFANDLEPVPDPEARRVRAEARGGPSWFAPGAVAEYAVWQATKEILPVTLVFRDRRSGELFVHLHPR